MKNHSTQKGSIVVVLLTIIVFLIAAIYLFFYIYNQIKSESSVDELKNKEVTNSQPQEQEYFGGESEDKGMMDIKVFFPKKEFSNCSRDISKEYFDSFPRTVKKTQNIAYTSLQELLKGITEDEKSKGYWSDIPDGVSIKSISLTDGRADVDLSKEVKNNPKGCGDRMRYWQMKLTLTQFPTITAATFTVNGDTKTTIQP